MSGVPNWARACKDSQKINLLDMPKYTDDKFVPGLIREETRLLILKHDTLIPVILTEQK